MGMNFFPMSADLGFPPSEVALSISGSFSFGNAAVCFISLSSASGSDADKTCGTQSRSRDRWIGAYLTTH